VKQCILHASLVNGNLILVGSDMLSEKWLTIGNTISMAINCSSEEEIQNFYEKLSAGGTKDHALDQSFWGASFGDLTDKYGNHWLLNYEKNKN
jgi:PhnB protein